MAYPFRPMNTDILKKLRKANKDANNICIPDNADTIEIKTSSLDQISKSSVSMSLIPSQNSSNPTN